MTDALAKAAKRAGGILRVEGDEVVGHGREKVTSSKETDAQVAAAKKNLHDAMALQGKAEAAVDPNRRAVTPERGRANIEVGIARATLANDREHVRQPRQPRPLR